MLITVYCTSPVSGQYVPYSSSATQQNLRIAKDLELSGSVVHANHFTWYVTYLNISKIITAGKWFSLRKEYKLTRWQMWCDSFVWLTFLDLVLALRGWAFGKVHKVFLVTQAYLPPKSESSCIHRIHFLSPSLFFFFLHLFVGKQHSLP